MLVLLDLDNTLVDRDRAFESWAEAFVTGAGGDATDVAWLLEADAQGYAPRLVVASGIRERLGLRDSAEALVSEMRSGLLDRLETYPGVPERLGALREAGAHLVVVTNGSSEQQRSKVGKVGIASLLDGLVISEEVRAKKPSPAIFAAARAFVSNPSAVWMVGDNPRADIDGARRVGFDTAWVSHGTSWPSELPAPTLEATATVSVLDDLIARERRRTPPIG